MPLPAQSLEQAIADLAIGNMRDNRHGTSQAGDFVEHVAGPSKRFVSRPSARVDVVQSHKPGHAERLMVIDPTQLVLAAAIPGLPPNLGQRDAAAGQAALDFHESTSTHHNASA